MRRVWILAALILGPGVAGAAEAPARSRLCPEDLPEGVRLPARPGCGSAVTPARREDGFRDLGGVSVRVNGRVSAEFGARR